MEYLVTWTIDLTADSPREAARQALTIQRDPKSWATVFTVTDWRGIEVEVDIDDDTDAKVGDDV